MLTVQDIARLLKCSVRTVYRLIETGSIPRPVRLGTLSRWPQSVIDRWIAQGCPVSRRQSSKSSTSSSHFSS
jgi:excisionase family DNA binding protein